MHIKNKTDVLKLLEEKKIATGHLGNFELAIEVQNIEEIVEELGNHTAFKLSHFNETIQEGYTEYGNANYELVLDGNTLTGDCLVSTPMVVIFRLTNI